MSPCKIGHLFFREIVRNPLKLVLYVQLKVIFLLDFPLNPRKLNRQGVALIEADLEEDSLEVLALHVLALLHHNYEDPEPKIVITHLPQIDLPQMMQS